MIGVPEDKLKQVLKNVEELRDDLKYLVERDTTERRIDEIKEDPSIGKSEEELDEYLEKRGAGNEG